MYIENYVLHVVSNFGNFAKRIIDFCVAFSIFKFQIKLEYSIMDSHNCCYSFPFGMEPSQPTPSPLQGPLFWAGMSIRSIVCVCA